MSEVKRKVYLVFKYTVNGEDVFVNEDETKIEGKVISKYGKEVAATIKKASYNERQAFYQRITAEKVNQVKPDEAQVKRKRYIYVMTNLINKFLRQDKDLLSELRRVREEDTPIYGESVSWLKFMGKSDAFIKEHIGLYYPKQLNYRTYFDCYQSLRSQLILPDGNFNISENVTALDKLDSVLCNFNSNYTGEKDSQIDKSFYERQSKSFYAKFPTQ